MTPILIFLLFVFQGVESDEEILNENQSGSISCSGEHTASIFWLRMRGNGFEYIGTYSKSKKKGTSADENKFTMKENSLEVKNFQQETDSGYYSCVSLNNNVLKFGTMVKLRGEKVQSTAKPKITTVQPVTTKTTAAVTCPQNTKGKKTGNIDVLLACEQYILIPLVAGCGILLLILVITIVYCNRIRTRRCPHHYKRHPRSRPAGHKTLPNPADY
ncbi:hypothetical protein KOW79_015229 [Hemibagrus wyckioides]|uniref:Ig-like domain-containing protein n=1 Tax=Hemibagrus wyckioides TaxID=337641 RepID=A0A9D3NE77_9TELE|nr:T-cell surface glycoprotein CD8 alpha chain [Hemibagrus wyckioides]KAG7320814.1 hypothetical protein KOW79_015229 [Hemibagrus wyckioides]